MGVEMSTSEVLNKAADLIEQHGWAVGSGWTDSGKGLCLEGGIIAALGIEVDVNNAAEYESFASCSAYAAVKDYLSTPRDLWSWNDALDRKASEVIEVLRATALIEAARERESVEV